MANGSGSGRPPTGAGVPSGQLPAGGGRPRRLYVRTSEEYLVAELHAASVWQHRGVLGELWQRILEAEVKLLVSYQLLDYYCIWERQGGRDPRSVQYSQTEMDWVLCRYRTVPHFAAIHDAAASVVCQYGLSPRDSGPPFVQDARVTPLDYYMLLLRVAACLRRAGLLIEMIG